MKNSFILYHSYKKHLSILTNEQKGVLFDAIFDYSENGTMPELEPILMMAFNFIQEDIDQNTKKWEETVEQRSEAGKKGAKARWEGHKKDGKGEDKMANDGKRILPLANDSKNAVNVSVNVNDSVSVSESVSDSVSEKSDMYICSFQRFWDNYPKKVGKVKAEQLYKRKATSEKKEQAILKGLQRYLTKWRAEKTQKQYIPNPTTWLNGERWDDELEVRGSGSGVSLVNKL